MRNLELDWTLAKEWYCHDDSVINHQKVKKRKKLRIKPKFTKSFGDKKILLNQKESAATKQFMVELKNYRL